MTAPTTTREAKADPEARRRVPSRPASRPGGRSSRGNSPRTSPPNEAKTKNEKRPPCVRRRSPSGGGCAKRPALVIRRQSFESIELVLALAAKSCCKTQAADSSAVNQLDVSADLRALT